MLGESTVPLPSLTALPSEMLTVNRDVFLDRMFLRHQDWHVRKKTMAEEDRKAYPPLSVSVKTACVEKELPPKAREGGSM